MSRVVRFLLKALYGLGLFLLFGVGMIFVALLVATLIAVFSPDVNSIFGKLFVLGFLVFLSVVFMIAVSWVRYRVGLWFYLQSLPKVDEQIFCAAFPAYEPDFLLEVRRVIAAHLQVEPDKISPMLKVGHNSPLAGLLYSLYEALFKQFQPLCVPELEMLTVKTARLVPRPAHIVEFPSAYVATMDDLLREIQQLKNLNRPEGG